MALPESTLAFAAPSFMAVALFLHVIGGTIGLVTGYTALLTRKGETVHRSAGVIFLVAMVTMGVFAGVLGVAKGQWGNAVGGLFTAYLVTTAWLAVKRPEGVIGRFEVWACVIAAVIAAISFWGGEQPGVNAAGVSNRVSTVFGAVVLIAVLGDLKVIFQRGISGVGRIARHLWRMCMALFVASGSFFLSQMEVLFPGSSGPYIWVLAFAPVAFLAFWLIRIRFRSALFPGPSLRQAAPADLSL